MGKLKSNYNFTPLKGYENFEATTQIIINEIIKRGLPFEIIDENNNLIAVEHNGRKYTILEGTISDANSLIAYWISNDKWMTKQFLERSSINFAKGVLVNKGESIDKIKIPKFPLVVKPADTDHGLGVSTAINSNDDLIYALDRAFALSDRAIVEEYYIGKEYRFLVIDGVTRAIIYREPANIVGDGKSTIGELINEKNRGRGDDYRHPLLKIVIDDEVERHLKNQSLTIDSVLNKGDKIYLRKNSNLSTGGDSIDYTDIIPDAYKKIAEKASKALGLNIAGVDIIISDYNEEPNSNNHIIIELNAPAMLSMHNYPYIGQNRNVEKYVLDSILNS